ncbi:hypothetical protein OAV21_03025 [bacterium]|jgi:hypothetical protein|nr:hypothetical protein [Verrucomicrobiales bacterium]MDC3255347.1 hypothetical protein [bacterium]MDF1787908.1 hypothetical protein [Verrucomicrobiales bacterium]
MTQVEFMDAYGTPVGLIAGALLVFVGTRLQHRVKRRQFDRRNAHGLEIFPSYAAKVRMRFREGFCEAGYWVLGGTGMLLMFIAFLHFVQQHSI